MSQSHKYAPVEIFSLYCAMRFLWKLMRLSSSAVRSFSVMLTRLASRTVSFVGPARILRTLQIRDQRVLDFVRTLHEGDEVDVTYRTAIAASVVPARRS